jgi:hypothetical protein
MAGGLMQLVAYGAQDVYLTGNPKVTFFQAVYKRHTNFAMECIEQTVNGTATNSGRVSVTVARNGDLVGEMFVEVKTASSGLDDNDRAWVAERVISDVELSIGGQKIDKHYQRWWALYSELYLDHQHKVNWGKMTSMPQTGVSKPVYLPLIFFFNRNPGLYLPLIALQYHEVRLDFDLSSSFDNYAADNLFKVWANYVYLDTEERRRFAQGAHEYLIEQVQHTGEFGVTAGQTTNVRLTYNHPVKELVWCFPLQTDSETLRDFGSASWDISFGESWDLLSLSGCPCDRGSEYFEESNGPLETFKLILNGQDRFKEQPGKYFNQVQPFYHHSGAVPLGIYSYSFALKPEEHQPTGTCNFSRIDNAQAAITLKNAPNNTTLSMFAVNYNVLRIQSGMGGLAFSN